MAYRDDWRYDWEKFFDSFGERLIPMHFYESTQTASVEDLYQMFKKRLLSELARSAEEK
jgi:hypothetical protein